MFEGIHKTFSQDIDVTVESLMWKLTNKELLDETVPSNKELVDGTVISNK